MYVVRLEGMQQMNLYVGEFKSKYKKEILKKIFGKK